MIHLVDTNPHITTAYSRSFAGCQDVTIANCDLISYITDNPYIDCIVSPANAYNQLSANPCYTSWDDVLPKEII